MDIKVVIEDIDDENALLYSKETGVEISIPAYLIDGNLNKGEVISVTIDNHYKSSE